MSDAPAPHIAIPAGTHRLGPANATLSVHTKRTGAAAKAGHDLTIHVTDWEATLEIGEDPPDVRAELIVHPTSFRVREGKGGMQSLGDDDRANIDKTIDDEILKRRDIVFRSTGARAGDDGRIGLEGDLTLAGTTAPIAFELVVGEDGALSATAVVTQSTWGMKPYSILFGSLKVVDEVEVVLDGHL